MQPLITIETVPISIEYVEKQSPHKASNSARLHISQQDHTRTIKSNPIKLPAMDTFSTASYKETDLSSLSYTATAQYSDNGNISMNVEMGQISSNNFVFENVGRGIDNIVDFLPKVSGNDSFSLSNMQINFDMSEVSGGISGSNALDTSFTPPDLELKVVERPKIIIKYVGGPIYIPRSADPNYVPPEETDQIFDGKSSFDAKA